MIWMNNFQQTGIFFYPFAGGDCVYLSVANLEYSVLDLSA